MKRTKEVILTLLAASLITACDSEQTSDVIWDVSPIEFNIFIKDGGGHDLLDSTWQNNWIKDLSVSYQGKLYPVMTESEYYEKKHGASTTRAYMPIFSGLILKRSWNYSTSSYGDFKLVFGEFSGTESIDKREITLNLPNGGTTSLSYKNSFRWKYNGAPDKNTVFYLNGKELNDNTGTPISVYHLVSFDSKGLESAGFLGRRSQQGGE